MINCMNASIKKRNNTQKTALKRENDRKQRYLFLLFYYKPERSDFLPPKKFENLMVIIKFP